MYNWLVSQAAWAVRAEARDWDAHMELLREALETATVRGDRIRLRSYLAGLEATRGEDLGTLEQEFEDMLGDSTDPDQRYFALLAESLAALVAGDADTAYVKAEKARASRCRAWMAQRASRSVLPSGPVTTSGSASRRPA